MSSKLCRQKCSCNVSLSEFGPRSASSLQNWNCLSAPAPDRQRTASDAACAHAWMTEIVHPQNRRATKDWTHFQNSTWGGSCVQRRGKGRELAAFPFCGPAKYLLLLQWGTTYRARIKGGPQVAMVGRKFTKLGARLSAGSVQRGYDRYYDNPVNLSNGPRYTDYGEELSVTLRRSSRKTDRPLFCRQKKTYIVNAFHLAA